MLIAMQNDDAIESEFFTGRVRVTDRRSLRRPVREILPDNLGLSQRRVADSLDANP